MLSQDGESSIDYLVSLPILHANNPSNSQFNVTHSSPRSSRIRNQDVNRGILHRILYDHLYQNSRLQNPHSWSTLSLSQGSHPHRNRENHDRPDRCESMD